MATSMPLRTGCSRWIKAACRLPLQESTAVSTRRTIRIQPCRSKSTIWTWARPRFMRQAPSVRQLNFACTRVYTTSKPPEEDKKYETRLPLLSAKPLHPLHHTTPMFGTTDTGHVQSSSKTQTLIRFSQSRTETPDPKKPLLNVLKQLTPHENIYTIPNILTFSRLIAAPVIGYLVLHDYHAWAVGLFAYAGITDLVDGYIARRWNLQTVVGTVIDPMADKTLMTILTVCLAVKGALPVWLAGIILGRDVGLAITAIYYRWISLPPPKTFRRYWDFSLPSAEVHPTTISKYNTALQLALVGATTAMPLVTVDVTTAMTAMQYLVATTTIWSGASYIYTKDAVKILNQDNSKKDKADEGNK